MKQYKIPRHILEILNKDFLTVFRNQLLIVFNDDAGLDTFYDDWLFRNESSAGWNTALYAACKEIDDYTVWKYVSELEWDDYDLFNSELGDLLIENQLVLPPKKEIVSNKLNIPIKDLISCVDCGHIFTKETVVEISQDEIAGTFYECYEKRPLYRCYACQHSKDKEKNSEALSRYLELKYEIDETLKGHADNPVCFPQNLTKALIKKKVDTQEILAAIDDIEDLVPYQDMRDEWDVSKDDESNLLVEIIRALSYVEEKELPENCLVNIIERLNERKFDFGAREGSVGEGCIWALVWLYRGRDMVEALKLLLGAGAVPYKGTRKYKSLYQMMLDRYKAEGSKWDESYKEEFLKASDLVKKANYRAKG